MTFANLGDPRTARVVPADHLGEEFGMGYQLRRAWIEKVPVGWWPANALGLSGESVTKGIGNYVIGLSDPVQWNNQLKHLRADPNRLRVGSGNIIRGH